MKRAFCGGQVTIRPISLKALSWTSWLKAIAPMTLRLLSLSFVVSQLVNGRRPIVTCCQNLTVSRSYLVDDYNASVSPVLVSIESGDWRLQADAFIVTAS